SSVAAQRLTTCSAAARARLWAAPRLTTYVLGVRACRRRACGDFRVSRCADGVLSRDYGLYAADRQTRTLRPIPVFGRSRRCAAGPVARSSAPPADPTSEQTLTPP